MLGKDRIAYRVRPTLPEAYTTLKEALGSRCFLITAGLCRVEYEGRAASKLGWGERVLLIKQDSSLLLHRAEGFEAVNWQPPGSIFTVRQEDGSIIVQSYRRRPREVLKIVFREVMLIACLTLVDTAEFEMHLDEEEIYKAILLNPSLIEESFRILSHQRRLESGVADFTGLDSLGRYTLVEVKRRSVDTAAVKQAYKYLAEFKSRGGEVRCILAAPTISGEARRLSTSLGIEFKRLELAKCRQSLAQHTKSTLKGESVKPDQHIEDPNNPST